jgi:hypothetical protein
LSQMSEVPVTSAIAGTGTFLLARLIEEGGT